MNRREIPRWNVGLAVALLCGAAGIVLGNTAVFLGAVVGFGYAVYGSVTRPPELAVGVERTLSDASPKPGSTVDVTVTVTNEGDNPLTDLRVVDGVPESLEVVEGTPRRATSLRPGESESFSYSVPATRGDHTFEVTYVAVRNISASIERSQTKRVESVFSCESTVEQLPLAEQTIPFAGRVETDSGGEGVEFYAIRQYTREDPSKRIDWRRYARTGELSTVEFRETRAATVVLVVDGRKQSHIADHDGALDAVSLSEYAAERVAGVLLGESNRVGVARLGGTGGYVAPRAGRTQSVRVSRFLVDGAAALPSGTVVRGVGRHRLDSIRKRLPRDAQVIFFSPLADDEAVEFARRFEAYGHRTTVLTPDVTPETPGGTLARLEREERLHDLRSHEVRVAEWSPDEPLHVAVSRGSKGWVR
ncbi:hypothetical protein AUR64_13490 [Haloprofundus marisrubri]|uniref:DUF58 domain-containing protein n=1 Tax=Haloprofundus marisrubri TaxID=1514971 RepID=A0A0W1R5W2_9EURY|nr:DUF58 domain-containing protein [Haloprofundus marisrubri]KTG08827.1 hypothetical protein AUR64_13490 [Haloprofundus marisrubri]